MTVKIQNIDGFFMSDPVRDPDRSTPAGIGGYIDEGCTSCIGGFVTVIHNEIDFGGPGKFPSCDTHFGGAVPADTGRQLCKGICGYGPRHTGGSGGLDRPAV